MYNYSVELQLICSFPHPSNTHGKIINCVSYWQAHQHTHNQEIGQTQYIILSFTHAICNIWHTHIRTCHSFPPVGYWGENTGIGYQKYWDSNTGTGVWYWDINICTGVMTKAHEYGHRKWGGEKGTRIRTQVLGCGTKDKDTDILGYGIGIRTHAWGCGSGIQTQVGRYSHHHPRPCPLCCSDPKSK